jgi:hypothetical protein
VAKKDGTFVPRAAKRAREEIEGEDGAQSAKEAHVEDSEEA